MPIISLHKILNNAYLKKYAIPAFNVWTYQDALAFIKAAEQVESPLILQASGTCIEHNGIGFTWQMIHNAVKNAEIPVAVHLDHAMDMELIQEALELGFTSIMFDGSQYSLEENIEKTIQVKSFTDQYDAFLEAEIGRVKKYENEEGTITEPKTAAEFAKKTGVDSLAVSVGTEHGMQKSGVSLNFDLIKTLSQTLDLPLVVHGASSIADDDLKIISSTGICKVNFASRCRRIFIESLGKLAPEFQGVDHIHFIMKAYEAVTHEAKYILTLLGSAGTL